MVRLSWKEDMFKVVTRQVMWKIAYATAALLVLLLSVWGYGKAKENSRRQVDVLFLGDSLIGMYRDESSIPYLVAQELELEVYNGALGGSCMAKINRAGKDTFQNDAISFAALSRAVAYGEFGWQQSCRVRQAAAEHFPQVIDELSQIDVEKLRCLLIEYGTNDYFGGIPVENPENPYDEYTFAGALRGSLEELQEAFPQLRIVLVTPTYNWYYATEGNCENMEFGGGYLKEYVDKIHQIAAEYEVECLDLYGDFYPTGDFLKAYEYTEDGVHPNEAGRKKIAQAIVDFIGN